MRLIEIAPNVWINVGVGAVVRIDMEVVRGVYVPTIFLTDGHKLGFSGQSLADVVKAVKSHERNEGESNEY